MGHGPWGGESKEWAPGTPSKELQPLGGTRENALCLVEVRHEQ